MLGRFDEATPETIVLKEVMTVVEDPFWEIQK